MLQTPINVEPSGGRVKTAGNTISMSFTFQGDLLTFVQGEVADMEYYGNPSSGTNQYVMWYNMPMDGHLSTIHNGQKVSYSDAHGWMAARLVAGHNYKHRFRLFQHYPEGMTTTFGGSTVSISGTPMPDMYYARGKIMSSTGNYSNTSAYARGDVCTNSGYTYACNTTITKNEDDQYNSDGASFNSNHWTRVYNYQTVIEPNLENIKEPFYYTWTDSESVTHRILLGAIYIDILYERHMISAYDKTTGIVTFQKVTFDPNTTEYTAQEILSVDNDTSLTSKFSVDEHRPYKMYTNYLESGWYDFKWRTKPTLTAEIQTTALRSGTTQAQRNAIDVGIYCQGSYSQAEAVGLKWYQFQLYAVDADDYSVDVTYQLDALVIYDHKLYKCTRANNPGAFNPSYWVEVRPEDYGTLIDESERTFSYDMNTGFPVHLFNFGHVIKFIISTQDDDVETATYAIGKSEIDPTHSSTMIDFTPVSLNGKPYIINDNTQNIIMHDTRLSFEWTALRYYYFDVYRREIYRDGSLAPFATFIGKAEKYRYVSDTGFYRFTDYSASNNVTYQYELIAREDRSDAATYGSPYCPVYIYNISVKWDGWSIMALTPQNDNTNRHYMKVGDEWKFISEIDGGDITRNITSTLHIGTSAYAKTTRNNTKYESGSFTANLLKVSCPNNEIVDDIERVNKWMNFVCGNNPFLLKSNKGDVWVVSIVNSPSRQYEENSNPIFTKIRYEWAESENKDKCVFN